MPQRWLRWRIWMLMALVASVAVGMGGYTQYRRLRRLSQEYRAAAKLLSEAEDVISSFVQHNARETLDAEQDLDFHLKEARDKESNEEIRRLTAELCGKCRDRVTRLKRSGAGYRSWVAYYASLRSKYEHAARNPWLPVAPDPPPPPELK